MTGTPRANRPVIMTFHDVGLNRKSSPSCSIHRRNIYTYKKASSCIILNYIPYCQTSVNHLPIPVCLSFLQTNPASQHSSTTRTCRRSSGICPFVMLKHRGRARAQRLCQLRQYTLCYSTPFHAANLPSFSNRLLVKSHFSLPDGSVDPTGTPTPPWTSCLKLCLLSSNTLGKADT